MNDKRGGQEGSTSRPLRQHLPSFPTDQVHRIS